MKAMLPPRAGRLSLLLPLLLAACGGGNPLGNPEDVENPVTTEGRHLSFSYF